MSNKVKLFGKRSLEDATRHAQQIDGEWKVPCVLHHVFFGTEFFMSPLEYQAGHDIALELGGKHTADNHLPLCGECNKRQGMVSAAQLLDAEEYSKRILAARQRPVNHALVENWSEMMCWTSKQWLKRHGSKEQKGRINY